MRLITALKIVASIIFIRIHNRPNAAYTSGNNIRGPYNIKVRSGIIFQRLLTEQKFQKGLDESKLKNAISKNNSYKNVKYTSDDLGVCARLQESDYFNDLEIYKEKFKHKYAKWKGLKRLDGYFEKKYI
ncbi:Uncharacterized protein PCOAH_00048060 [Plasmodium coatneyi]|uniref:Uncharacterized protein n=1 Tax=Plasmodium coatneyi TaxID=208452 RepID=A0A1B1E6B3_9APIC|nr:Uncharacterized protein PCOAH_00048060 [Plasmodium coatneyi]ANQ10523.1 Uncharacterized protein PCOAH_00048060 [Plasmodium coatneyi]